MDYFFDNNKSIAAADERIDGIAKVTGTAMFATEAKPAAVLHAVLIGSTIAKGNITAINSKAAERAAGVTAVFSHLNTTAPQGYQTQTDPGKPPPAGQPLRVFFNNEIFFYGQPIAMVVADTLERARYAAKLVQVQYKKQGHKTDLEKNLGAGVTPSGPRFEDYKRGSTDAYKDAAVVVEAEYLLPDEMHNPMELSGIIAQWTGDDSVQVWTKTQGVKSTQRTIATTFKIPEANIKVVSEYVGGSFGVAIRTWPHEIAALMAAKKLGKAVKLNLTREQMHTMVGYRPHTKQQIVLAANKEGQLQGIQHRAWAKTSAYEQFTEGTVGMTKMLYACPNVLTQYKVVPLNACTPTWMRGPGEATGSWALESAMDELAFKLGIDPLQLRIINHADTDPERNLPWSSKYLKECYSMGAEKIGWANRNAGPKMAKDGDWWIGYGMGTGVFGAFRGTATVKATLANNGTLQLQTAANDMGPGLSTAMAKIAEESLGIPLQKIKVQLGHSDYPNAPTQGGSSATSTVGSAVYDVCIELKSELAKLAAAEGSPLHTATRHAITAEDLLFGADAVAHKDEPAKKVTYAALLQSSPGNEISLTRESKDGSGNRNKYSMYSFSVHFIKLGVHSRTGQVRILDAVSTADAGAIVSPKTAAGQIVGGAVGGLGMALMEHGVTDHRFGKLVTNNLADYHVPVHADIPKIEALFVNKKDPYTNPMGSKGLGEISLVGMAAAVANAVFNATGIRVRELPITPDKLMGVDSV